MTKINPKTNNLPVILFIGIIFLLAAAPALAAPAISNVYWSGNLDNADEVTISGTGFDAGPGNGGPNVIIFDNWDDGGANNTANDLDATDSGGIGSWSSTGQAGGLMYYIGDYVSGNRSAKLMDDAAINGAAQWRQNILSFPDSQEFFMSWWWKLPSNKRMENSSGNCCMGVESCSSAWGVTIPCCSRQDPGIAGNYKFYYLGDDKSGKDFWADDNIIDSFSGNSQDRIWGNSVEPPSMWPWHYSGSQGRDWLNCGDWIRFDDYLKGDPEGGTIYTDNAIAYARRMNQDTSMPDYVWSSENTGSMTSKSTSVNIPPDRWNTFSFLGYMRTYTPNAMQIVDDFYFAAGDNARARVELCNTSDYDTANKCFISPPISWSSTQIRIKAQQGNLGTGNFWVHVFDAEGRGTVSGPYRFNSSGTEPPVCTPDCSGKVCGPDGCPGGSCGTCQPGSTCNSSGQCIDDNPTAPGDLNGDNTVDVIDLGIFLANWGATSRPPSDINQDGHVDIIDLGIMLGNWGTPAGTQTLTLSGTNLPDTYLNINTNNYYTASTMSLWSYSIAQPRRIANTVVIRPNLSALPVNAQIESAVLTLHQTGTHGEAAYPVSVHRLTRVNSLSEMNGQYAAPSSPWTPAPGQTDNDSYPLGLSDIAAAEDQETIGSGNQSYTWDITDMVKYWQNNPNNNYGLLLKGTETNTETGRIFASADNASSSLRPTITVRYTEN